MGYEIQAEELYNLVSVDASFDSESLERLIAGLTDGLLETPYVVVKSVNEAHFGGKWLSLWVDFNDEVADREGLLIFVEFDQKDVASMEEFDLMHLPTLVEAVDYIYMDRLEKELDLE